MRKRVLNLCIVFVLCFPIIMSVTALAENVNMVGLMSGTIAGGSEGTILWDITNGTLTISGSGEMKDYRPPDLPPWYRYKSSIQEVYIDNGVTTVGEFAFTHCSNLERAIVSDSVTWIKQGAFQSSALTDGIYLPTSLKKIDSVSFLGASSAKIYYAGMSYEWKNIDIHHDAFSVLNTFHYNTPLPLPSNYQIAPSLASISVEYGGSIEVSFIYTGSTYAAAYYNIRSLDEKIATIEQHDTVKGLGTTTFTAKITGVTVGSTALVVSVWNKSYRTLISTQLPVTIRPRESPTYAITFNANGGSVSLSSKSVIPGSIYGVLPTPTRLGYIFDGWYTSINGGARITDKSTVSLTSNQTLYAHWLKDESSTDTQIFIENKYVFSGASINIPVKIKNNPGIAGVTLTVSYDKSVLTLNNIAKGALFETGSYNTNLTTDVVQWYYTENVTNDGILFTLQFTVNNNAQDGDYNIAVGLHDGIPANLSNADFEIVDAQFISGVLKITSGIRGDVTGDGVVAINDVVKLARAVAGSLTLTEAERTVADVTGDGVIAINDVVKLARYVAGSIATLQSVEAASLLGNETAVIEVATVNGKPGETVRIPVSITANPGIAGAQLDILFDSGLTLKNIIQGDVLYAGTFNPDISNRRIQWYYDQANLTDTGVLFTLEFEVSAEAQNGSAYAVTVNVKDGIAANLSDYDFNSVNAEFKPGKVQIDETSDNTVINTVSCSGNMITANVVCADSNASVFCVVYNNNGKMIAASSDPITSESSYKFQFDGQQFDYAKVFIVDGNFRPLCESK